MFNSKYYIYLIVSIFLALGLGIMIGVALENKNIIEDQQASLIKQIEDNILLYRSETESLKDSIKTMELENKVLYDVFDKLVTEVSYNQLLGTSVGLVCFDEELDIEYVKQLLEHTGAFIKTSVVFSLSNYTGIFYDKAENTSENGFDLIHYVIEDLVYSLYYGGNTALIAEMEELGVLKNELNFESPVDKVVIVGGGKTTSKHDSILIKSLKNTGLDVVLVESNSIADSAIEDYVAYGISTIDNINTIYGRMAFVSVMMGNKGNFGTGPHSNELVPERLFVTQDETSYSSQTPD